MTPPAVADAAPEDPARRANRRAGWLLGGGCAALLGVIVWFYLFYDMAPPDPALYQVAPPPEPEDEEEKQRRERMWGEIVEAWRGRVEWDGSAAFSAPSQDEYEKALDLADNKHLEHNASLVRKFWDYCRTFSLESLPKGDGTDPDARNGMVFGLKKWMILDFERDLNQGRTEALLEKSFLLMKFGQISGEEDSSIYASAREADVRGIDGVFQAMEKLNLKAAELRRLQKRLLDTEPDPRKLAKMIRWRLSQRILDYQQLPLNQLLNSMLLPPPLTPPPSKWDDSILFKPNMTQVELAGILGILASAFERNAHEGWKELKAAEAVADSSRFPDASWKTRIHPNRTGIGLVARDIDNLQTYLVDDLNRLSLRRCLRLALALRAFQLEKGRLPEALEALTPEYLEVLPEDPVTGLPLKWNRETGAIYSVGSDERDDGGDVSFSPSSYWESSDWGIGYPWQENAGEDAERR